MTKYNNLKTVLLILLIFIMGNEIKAQYLLNGIVRDSISHSGVPYHSVTITKAGSSYAKTVLTDNSGFFFDTLNVVIGQHKVYYITTLDCNQNQITDSIITHTSGITHIDICTGNTQLCIANFMYFNSFGNNKKVFFSNQSSLSADKYLWSFGDGDSSFLKNPMHTYTNSGNYPVCLTVIDTNSNSIDVFCDTVLVSAVNPCTNSFTSSITGLNTSFIGNVNNNYTTEYSWNFGDGTPIANGQQIAHSYNYGGTFQACLTTKSIHPQTYDTCIANSCQNIVVTGQPRVNFWGQVFQGVNPADKGLVYLYEYDILNKLYTLVDSTEILSIDSLSISYYYFESIPHGIYMTKASLYKYSQYYSDYAPSYYGNTLHWEKGQSFNLQNAGYNFPINLSKIESNYGLASVGGKVMEGTVKAPGDPVANVPLFLINADNQLMGYTHSSMSGEYSFADLPYHKYYVYADLVNYDIYPSVTIANEGDKFKDNVDIYIGQGRVTGINDAKISVTKTSIYPNPVTDVFQLKFELNQKANLSVEIFNMIGTLVFNPISNTSFDSGKHIEQINIDNLPIGVYNILIKNENRNLKTIKLVVLR